MCAVANDADSGVCARCACDTENGDEDGNEALRWAHVIYTRRVLGVQVIMDFAEEPWWVRDDDDANQSDEAGDEISAREGLAEEDVAEPCCDQRHEEAEDCCFGEGKIMY